MTSRAPRCVEYRHERFSSVWSSLREDILRFATFHPDYRPEINLRSTLSILLQPPILCLLGHRISHCLWVRGWRAIARGVAHANQLVHKANIPADSCIGPGCFLGHSAATSFIGCAGRELTLFSLAVCCPGPDEAGDASGRGPRLGDRVTVGAHSTVVGAIEVGDDVKIAPKTWLDRDCPAHALAVSTRLRHRIRPPASHSADQSRSVR